MCGLSTPVTDILLSFLFGVLPLVLSWILFRRVRGAVARRKGEAIEANVLKVARERGGTVTAVDVAADCGMSLEQAQETLDRLHLGGFCQMDVGDAGTVVYRFRL